LAAFLSLWQPDQNIQPGTILIDGAAPTVAVGVLPEPLNTNLEPFQ
jgi:hypothetical protein